MAAGTTSNEAKISIKIMLQKDKNKVIFAEADHHFVDILFSFMTLPLGTIVKILEDCPDENDLALGGLRNLYQSLKDLPANYFSTDEAKYILLNPRSSTYNLCRKLKINIDDTGPLTYFTCRDFECTRFKTQEYSHCKFAKCGECGDIMDREIKYGNSTANAGGDQGDDGLFVSELTSFIVTDDLRVMPNTSDVWIQLFRDHGITNSCQLEERTVDVGREQIIFMLKGALLFKSSLTYMVFPRTHHKKELVGTLVQSLMKNVGKNTKRMTLKVTQQKSTSKFLFAEAEAGFVDFLFSFLAIPLGVVIGKFMNGNTSLVCLDNLFASLSSIGEGKYLKIPNVKDMLCEPQLAQEYLSRNQNFQLNVLNNSSLYLNLYWSSGVAYFDLNRSPGESSRCLSLKDPRVEGSFLKEPAKFMLSDDLCVTTLSSFSAIAVLNKLKVPLNDVENQEISIGIKEGLELLKASVLPSLKCLSHLSKIAISSRAVGRAM